MLKEDHLAEVNFGEHIRSQIVQAEIPARAKDDTAVASTQTCVDGVTNFDGKKQFCFFILTAREKPSHETTNNIITTKAALPLVDSLSAGGRGRAEFEAIKRIAYNGIALFQDF